MKYKVGDKVLVRNWDDMGKEFGLDKEDIAIPHCYFVEKMKKYCSDVVTICKINIHNGNTRYNIREDDGCWFWCSEMFEPNFHFKPAIEPEKLLMSEEVSNFVDCSITNKMCDDLLNYSYTSMKNEVDKLSKEIEEMKKETKPKQQKQKTKRERLEEKIAKYQADSGIESIEIIASNKVIKIKMDNMFSHWKSEYKMVCDDQDVFSLERAIYLAYAKNECRGKYTSEYIELYADKLAMEKKHIAMVKAAMNLYENQEELKKLDEEEAAMIQKKKEKRWKQKERRAERKRNEQIAMQKEAYVQAWKEIKELKKSNKNKVQFTNDQDIRL